MGEPPVLTSVWRFPRWRFRFSVYYQINYSNAERRPPLVTQEQLFDAQMRGDGWEVDMYEDLQYCPILLLGRNKDCEERLY